MAKSKVVTMEEAMTHVHSGMTVMIPGFVNCGVPETLINNGMTVKQIAEDTGVTTNTVGYYLKKAYKKLNVHSREELVELLGGLDEKQTE